MLTIICRKFFLSFPFLVRFEILWHLYISEHTHTNNTQSNMKKKKNVSAKCHQQFNVIWQESLCA